MNAWVGLVLIAALCGCGQERTADPKLPLLEPDLTSTTPLGEQVDVIFEEHRREAGSATTVISQLAVSCRIGQEFHAQGTWGTRHFSLTGTAWKPADHDWVSLHFAYDSWCAYGSLTGQTTLKSSEQLKSQTRTLLGGMLSQAQTHSSKQQSQTWTSSRSATDVTAENTMLYVWIRPCVTPPPTQPLSPKP